MLTCICCGTGTNEWLYADGFLGNLLRLCPNCRHVQLSEIPSQEKISNYYLGDYSRLRSIYVGERYASIMRKRAAAQLVFIKRNIALNDIRVCDVGCGYGFLLAALKQYTPHIRGVEYDTASVAYCTERGLAVGLLKSENDLLDQPKTDLVTLSHCLEHFAHPKESLTALGKRACSLFLEVPAYDPDVPEQFFDLEGHMNFFNNRSLRLFLERNGFDIVSYASYGPSIRFFYSSIYDIARRICRIFTHDLFMNRYASEHPRGIWLRVLARRKENS